MTDTINTPTELGDAMRNGVEVQRHDREEHKVIEIRRGNGPIVKEPNPYYAGHTYKVPVIYVLDDGTEEEARETCRLLRDAKAFDATLPCAPRVDTICRGCGAEGRPSELLYDRFGTARACIHCLPDQYLTPQVLPGGLVRLVVIREDVIDAAINEFLVAHRVER